ncbi:MAG: RNase adapter RapZ [Polyangiaceae bacterium]
MATAPSTVGEPWTRIVVVTGLSGAGKSTAMSALEDGGFYCIENLPASVIEAAIEACESRSIRTLALTFGAGMDTDVDEAAAVLNRIAASSGASPKVQRSLRVFFLDASDEALLRRFNETRRPHPLRRWETGREQVIDGIRLERDRLGPLRALATVVIDTSGMRVHDLRRRISSMIRAEGGSPVSMQVRVLSFGFKHGVPSDADLVFDVRFLDNPHFVDELRPLTGVDERVRAYVLKDPAAAPFLEKTRDLLTFLLPRYAEEGKSYLTIALGCTGGQHRSVTTAIVLGDALEKLGYPLRVVHRDAHVAPVTAPPEPTPSGAAHG